VGKEWKLPNEDWVYFVFFCPREIVIYHHLIAFETDARVELAQIGLHIERLTHVDVVDHVIIG
jgi:predicted DNA-binding transcriptional regulator